MTTSRTDMYFAEISPEQEAKVIERITPIYRKFVHGGLSPLEAIKTAYLQGASDMMEELQCNPS